ncbi:MAG: hypothetical protein HYX80_08635 [Chloroflexi bacterium]|nr:hypothetical protein [Chloroflexota bacterium]
MVSFGSSKRETLVKQALEQIRYLQTLPYRNNEFKPWLDKTTAALKVEYGAESVEVRRFVNAAGKAFVVGTETGREQEYQRQLESYEEVLMGLVGR